MRMSDSEAQRGITLPLVLTSVAVVVVVAGIVYYLRSSSGGLTPTTSDRPTPLVSPRTQATNEPLLTPDRAIISPTVTGSYTGTVLAGTTNKLLDFNQADFERANASGDLVALYFYADWCPICREEFPKMEAAFNELSKPGVVGFRVNFNDNQTDSTEENLARQHGVAYQHTKVLLKNGQRILKSPETWEKDRYLSEITSRIP